MQDDKTASSALPPARLMQAAITGDANAQYGLGQAYREGRGVPKNARQAAEWFLKSAMRGHAEAQNVVGMLYLNGEGVPKVGLQAQKWFIKAAEQGHPGAQYRLGGLYGDGRGVPKDEKEAAAWYRKAAEQDHPEAQYELGVFHFAGRGVPQDDEEATRWWIEAGANQEYEFRLHALCQALEMISMGRGVPSGLEREQAIEKARQDLETACPPELRDIVRNSMKQMGEQGEKGR